MNTTPTFARATRAAGKLFFTLLLLLIAVVIGFGGTALFVYHQFASSGPAAAPGHKAASGVTVNHTPAASDAAPTRRVAALPSDQPSYSYAVNNDAAPAPVKRPRTTANVPAPLATPADADQASGETATLNDPESHYIVDSNTGRVIGIDGTAGARHEAEVDAARQAQSAPPVVAVQTPAPEVRVASPVLDNGVPIVRGLPAAPVNTAGAQYLPVRRALPVTPGEEADSASHTFNAREYLASEPDDRPVLRALPVVPAGARVVKTLKVYRLPDGTQTVASY